MYGIVKQKLPTKLGLLTAGFHPVASIGQTSRPHEGKFTNEILFQWIMKDKVFTEMCPLSEAHPKLACPTKREAFSKEISFILSHHFSGYLCFWESIYQSEICSSSFWTFNTSRALAPSPVGTLFAFSANIAMGGDGGQAWRLGQACLVEFVLITPRKKWWMDMPPKSDGPLKIVTPASNIRPCFWYPCDSFWGVHVDLFVLLYLLVKAARTQWIYQLCRFSQLHQHTK